MGSKGRLPPPHLRRPLPGPGLVHPDHFGPGIRPPPGPFPPYDMLPHSEILEQKLAAQHLEMQKLLRENERLAATHGTLRQELAAVQHELQLLHAQIGAVKAEREQQMRGLVEKIAKMEAELQNAESIKLELQQARGEAQSLVAARQDLLSKVQQLTQELQRSHSEAQHIPALMSELESLRQEYQHCRATYDYEKKLYNDHLESLQVMEKNYVAMAREVEKLQAELTNAAGVERAAGGPYGGNALYNDNEASGHRPVVQNYEDAYGVPQGGRGPLPAGGGGGGGGTTGSVSAAAGSGGLTPTYTGTQPGPPPARPTYDAARGASYDPSRGPSFDPQGGSSYDAQRGHAYNIQRAPPTYDVQRGPGYDSQRGPNYDPQRGSNFDPQRGPAYDPQRGSTYDVTRAAVGPRGQAPAANMPYGSATPPTHAAGTYETPARGNNPGRR